MHPVWPRQARALGTQATAFARQLLTDQRVTLAGDPTQADRDRYQRLLRYVRLADGRDYSVEVTRAGWARSYRFQHNPVQEQSQIDAAQGEVQAAGRASGDSARRSDELGQPDELVIATTSQESRHG